MVITFCLPFFRSFGILIPKLRKRGCCTWHTLLALNALAVELAKKNAQFPQLAKATINSSLMQNSVPTVALAPVFVQLRHQIQLNHLCQ